ncbi:MAG: ATP synthase F1 subunit gamma [Phycisphaerales bacterium]
MAQLREIKKRMGAVKTIQRITKTMQMIATAKFTASLVRAKNSRPYTDTIRELVAKVASQAGDASHPLLETPSGAGKELVLVISSDRGLCGAYNSNVLRTAGKLLAELRAGGREIVLDASGRKALAFFKYQKQEISAKHSVGDRPQYAAVEEIAQGYIDRFVAGEFSSVKVVYMRFISTARQRPEVMQLLPLSLPKADAAAGAAKGTVSNFEFSPSAPELLGDLLPRSVKVSLYQAFLDAVVSENVMRMVAMKAATDNAGGLGRTLKRSYNRARQARITTELTEIVAGVEALK